MIVLFTILAVFIAAVGVAVYQFNVIAGIFLIIIGIICSIPVFIKMDKTADEQSWRPRRI